MLEAQVRDAQAGFQGWVSLYAKNLRTGADFGQGADTRVQTASTIKTAILAGAHAAVAAGQADWEEILTLTGDNKAAGAGVLLEMNDGPQRQPQAAVHLMIVVSDNTATNLVLDRIGADTVNDYLDSLGVTDIRCLRRIGGGGDSRAAALPENAGFGIGVATPRSFVTLLEALEAGRVVSAESSAEMLGVMKRQQQRLGIGRRPQNGIAYASKPGALDRLRSDIGLLWSAGGPLALAITCDQLPETNWSADNPASLLIARLSEIFTGTLGA